MYSICPRTKPPPLPKFTLEQLRAVKLTLAHGLSILCSIVIFDIGEKSFPDPKIWVVSLPQKLPLLCVT